MDVLPEAQRAFLIAFGAQENPDTPWTPLPRPLATSRLALVTTAGLHHRDDAPFRPGVKGGDPTYRVIETDRGSGDLLTSHPSIGFDRTGMQADVNVAFPLDRLVELSQRGFVGSVATRHYSFIGAIQDVGPIQRETGPEVARQLVAQGVDAVLLTGT
ncbi:MAG: glycine/sarcosine/betaine reductase selenoprotein B family protein [Chloroflexota bacterium]